MECTLTGRGLRITTELRELIDRRLHPLERVFGKALAFPDKGLHSLAEGGNWQSAGGTTCNNVVYQEHNQNSAWQACRCGPTPNAPQHNELRRSI
ncbi:MAG: hypothetical protein CL483_08470 [Acidobacteria bacterium]|mgnify:CR=1 FL=1|nr:hypothetical protein [Acidobacteriota bacterium]